MVGPRSLFPKNRAAPVSGSARPCRSPNPWAERSFPRPSSASRSQRRRCCAQGPRRSRTGGFQTSRTAASRPSRCWTAVTGAQSRRPAQRCEAAMRSGFRAPSTSSAMRASRKRSCSGARSMTLMRSSGFHDRRSIAMRSHRAWSSIRPSAPAASPSTARRFPSRTCSTQPGRDRPCATCASSAPCSPRRKPRAALQRASTSLSIT